MRLVELKQYRIKESVLREYEEEKANGTMIPTTFEQEIALLDEALREIEEQENNEDSKSN